MDAKDKTIPGNIYEPAQENQGLVNSGYVKPEAIQKCHIEERKWRKNLDSMKKKSICGGMDRWMVLVSLILLLIFILFLIFIVGLISMPGDQNSDESPRKDTHAVQLNLRTFQEPREKEFVTPVVYKSPITAGTTTRKIEEIPASAMEVLRSTTEALATTTMEIETTQDELHPMEYFGKNADKNSAESCLQHLANGGSSGIYPLHRGQTSMSVFCDMNTDNGGWTVIQRRVNKKESFYNRNWSDYVNGFGSLDDSHWLGLENIHTLAPLNDTYATLRIELHGDMCKESKCSQEPNGFWFGEWDFRIGDASTNYKLDISPALKGNLSVVGNYTDAFYATNNGQSFTTIDKDLDSEPSFNCAQFRMYGGWWHSNCTSVSLNGLYGDHKAATRYMMWIYTESRSAGRIGLSYPIHPKKSIMMIRPKY